MNAKRIAVTSFGVWLLVAAGAQARIKLVALPERAATVIRLDNPNATLIEEERVLTLQKGLNKVDFSWKGVQIDEDSIRLVSLDHPADVTLLSISYPPGEAALVWEINSTGDFAETVRISYLLSNIDRLITYKAVANKAETFVDLKSYLVLRNFSGEDFEKARVLLDYGEAFQQGIDHEETKQMLFLSEPNVPVRKIWTFDAASLPWDPEQLENQNVGIPVSYEVTNSDKAGLGKFALWGGKARLFQQDGHGSTIFLGEDNASLVPVGEKMELYIGDSRDIVVTQRKMRDAQIEIRKNNSGGIVLFDTDEIITAKIENFKESSAVLTMIQHIPGQWDMAECNLQYTKKDAFTLKFEIELPARTEMGPGVKELTMHYHRRNVRP
ncbi:MAG TPA: hypothetical protein PKH24_01150 [Sedimentisphaerales bacterium]|jgi:hypothetical protein|nr:hypothetical protein [Sedimentisphaerales bacterium]HNU27865.1 hypothetical protein [Sedimentisphaerales bacterium]